MQEGQRDRFGPGDETTHSLAAERQRRRVSGIDLDQETRQRTLWQQNGSTRGSAGKISIRRRATHSLAAERQHRRVSRKDFNQDETTHYLVAERQHRRVSGMDLDQETRQHTGTNWWQSGSAGGSTGWIWSRRRDNAHPGGRMAAQEGQQDGFGPGDETTHLLVADRHHKRVSRMGLDQEAR